jgi:hypothetical protein
LLELKEEMERPFNGNCFSNSIRRILSPSRSTSPFEEEDEVVVVLAEVWKLEKAFRVEVPAPNKKRGDQDD